MGQLVTLAADAALASPQSEGRLVPVLILDTSERPDIDEAIRVHAHIQPGDVKYRWATVENVADLIVLLLGFVRPIELRAAVGFSIENQGILIESALTAKAIYIQGGKPGDRFSDMHDRPRIFVDMPEDDFRDKWNALVIKRMTKVFQQRSGTPKSVARRQAQQLLEETRKITTLRLPPR